MTDIATTKKDIDALSFDAIKGLHFTNGQLKLLHLLNEKLLKKEPVTIADLSCIYWNYAATQKKLFIPIWDGDKYPQHSDKIGTRYIYSDHKQIGYWLNIDDYVAIKGYNYCAVTPTLQWTKLNIGALVLKGALIAIPVLQIGEDALKGIK